MPRSHSPATAGIIAAAADETGGMTHSIAAEYIASALMSECGMDTGEAFAVADQFLCDRAGAAWAVWTNSKCHLDVGDVMFSANSCGAENAKLQPFQHKTIHAKA